MIPTCEQVAAYVAGNHDLACALGLEAKDSVCISVEPFSQGEHNLNFLLTVPRDHKPQRFVLRLGIVSQLGLVHQMAYEYGALVALRSSTCTPAPFFLDISASCARRSILVEEYREGTQLDFSKPEQVRASLASLAAIHALAPDVIREEKLSRIDGYAEKYVAKRASAQNNVPVLYCPKNPLTEQLTECSSLIAEYRQSGLAQPGPLARLEQLFAEATRLVENLEASHMLLDKHDARIINTEAVPSHFLIDEGGQCTMVDWEKPILGDPAQDLAYFLSPTTTIWDTDYIFDDAARSLAVHDYCAVVAQGFDTEHLRSRLPAWAMTNCLRGLAWSARAWTQYHRPGLILRNEKTFARLDIYLDEVFYERCRSFIAPTSWQ